MRLAPFLIFSSAILLGAVLSGCATRPQRPDPIADYLTFLRENPGADLHGADEKAAIQRFQNFLSRFTEEKLLTDTRQVYAPQAFFNDTLKTVRGSAAIEKYFLETLKNTDEITVDFADVARSGNDYYFRWVMDVRFKKFHRGKIARTIGVTHVRFNRAGQVILHQDYWDSTQGLFEYVPVIGDAIRFIKARL